MCLPLHGSDVNSYEQLFKVEDILKEASMLCGIWMAVIEWSYLGNVVGSMLVKRFMVKSVTL